MIRLLIFLFFCSAYGQGPMYLASLQQAGCENIYTEQNAINDCDEANDVSGISIETGTGTATSTTSFTDGGTYSARFLHTGGVNEVCNFVIDFPVTNGTTYQVDARVWRASGSNNWFLRLDSGDGWAATSSDRVTAGSGFYETLTVTATADITGTALIMWNGSSGADGGDDNYIAYITVTII